MTVSPFDPQFVLEGERIKLVPMKLEHARDLFRINDRDLWAFMFSEISTLEEMERWVSEAVKLRGQRAALPFVVMLKDTDEIVGTTRMYEWNEKQKSCEVGSTWYDKDYQRTFANTETKFVLLQFCFEQLGMIRVQLKTDERNVRSRKAIERLGAVKEGILRNERILANGYVRNAVLYSITKEEWAGVKRGLRDRMEHYRGI
ncbi:GNAT family N-acetyltransferase [Rossellomorea aquimaris]|uniref:GNAT family N-acetyltransferase n=1 Tax=Rossellomorea aquimaris TaxID=189382 RepID=UPI001CD40835|nr:GNAT family protein [Rossellomorea aquimaris]MCA1054168.1 GNAT family N-acetyltransferase [Rossellomorea aquimaris]